MSSVDGIPTNVAIFTDNDFGKVTGVTTTLSAALRCLPADMRARVYTSADRSTDEAQYLAMRAPGITIPFYPGMRMYWPRLLAFARQARRDRIGLVHYTTPGPMGLAAMFTAWRLQVPMVGSFHTQLSEYAALLSGSRRIGELMRQYLRWSYGRCARVLVPSAATADLLAQSGVSRDKICIWNRGVDTDRFSPEQRSDALRAQWGVSESTPALLYVGRLSREKGLDALPALVRDLHHRGLPHRLVLVGDGPMRHELSRACPEAIFAGNVPHDRVGAFMASADVFVFPSRTDTFGNVVLEAQASGLPVVVTDEGGPREIVRDGVSGLICHLAQPPSLSEAVAELLRDTATRRAMGRAARHQAVGRNWEQALEPLYATWRETVRRRSRVPTTAALPIGHRSRTPHPTALPASADRPLTLTLSPQAGRGKSEW